MYRSRLRFKAPNVNGSQGQTMLQERRSVRKLRAALDEHASPAPKQAATQPFPRLAAKDNERKFERFVRAIRQCNDLSDARRFRSEVVSQLKRAVMVEAQDKTYLRRLETGKRLLDQKVEKLSAVGGLGKSTARQSDDRNGQSTFEVKDATIVEILHDASGLSYFMEYMDRHRLMSLVQFWIVVDGFRNPLEDDSLEEDDIMGAPLKWTDTDRLDIAQIHEAYISKPELGVSEVSREAVKFFLQAGRDATQVQYRGARSAILQAQTAVLEKMKSDHFPGFKRSDLYYKYIASDELSVEQAPRRAPNRTRELKAEQIKALTSYEPQVSRPSHRPGAKDNQLRRTATSSTDLKRKAYSVENATPQRHSFEMGPSEPLFPEEGNDTDPLARSAHSISFDVNSLNSSQSGEAQEQMVEAMEAALNDIMDNKPQAADERSPLFEYPLTSTSSLHNLASSGSPVKSLRARSSFGEKERERPNLASLGLVNMPSRIGVFSEEELFSDEGKFSENEQPDSEDAIIEHDPADEVVQAAPGDLGLAEAITVLTSDIERLVIQESIVDTLTRKAELTNNTAELRILGKSKSSLQREIHRKELQRQQYIVQESDNSLYGRATVEIKSVIVGKDEDGQEFALCTLAGYPFPVGTKITQMSSKYGARLRNKCRLPRGLLHADIANFMIYTNGYA